MEVLKNMISPVSNDPKLKDIRIISGNSHPKLVTEISDILDLPPTQRVLDKFSNSEIRVKINENIRCKDVVIVQTGAFHPEKGYSVNDYLMEILLLANTCTLSSAKSITLVCPLFPYARQDRKAESRTPISGKLVADLLETANISRIITLDLHSSPIAGFFKIPVDNLYSVNLFKSYIHENYKDASNLVIVSPDTGGTRRVDALAQRLNINAVLMNKVRDSVHKNTVTKTVLIGEEKCVKDKTCLIYDDMVDTAGTICKASETLMDNGAKEVIILAVHGILSGPAIDRINERKYIKNIVVTDSLPQEENRKKCPKLETIKIAPLLAKTICNLFNGESISELFKLF